MAQNTNCRNPKLDVLTSGRIKLQFFGFLYIQILTVECLSGFISLFNPDLYDYYYNLLMG